MSALDILQALAAGPSAAASRDVTLGPGSPRTFFQLFSGMAQPQQQMPDFSGQPSPLAGLGAGLSDGAQQKKSSGARAFIDKISGSPIGTLLGALGLGILGAGIGAISSPGARGLGAARGFGMGAGTGVLQDISMRRASAEIPANQQKIQLEKEKMLAGQLPTSYKEWELGYTTPEARAAYPYSQLLKDKQINPVALANLGLSNQKFGFEQEKFSEQMGEKKRIAAQLKPKELEEFKNFDDTDSQYNTILSNISAGKGPSAGLGMLNKLPFGERIVQGIDPERALAFKNMEEAQALHVKSISGAAVAEPEFRRLRPTRVQPTDDPEVARQLLIQSKKKNMEARLIHAINLQKNGKDISEFIDPQKMKVYEMIRPKLNDDFQKAIKDPQIQRARQFLGIDY